MAYLKKNFEREFALDYLDKPFFKDISPDLVKIVNGNYIVPMMKLYEHYRYSGEEQKAAWIRSKLLHIAQDTKDEEEVRKQLSQG
jgi:hypothetical protein